MLHVAYCGVIIAGTKFGIGSHIATVSHSDLVSSLKLLYIGNWFVIWAISLSKTSFALTLLSLVVRRWHSWALWFSINNNNHKKNNNTNNKKTQNTTKKKTWDPELDGICWDTHIV